MPLTQNLLFPDPRPLVERLGRDFFRRLPECPGVYLMRDARDSVLYVGKAKNLRKRLGSYRVANPDRMARRHLRMLRLVERIELQECADEAAALAREAELLMALKPKFNRAGTWPGKARFLVWRHSGEHAELEVTETPGAEGCRLGPIGSGAVVMRAVLARLLWFTLNPSRGMTSLPAGWAHGRMENPTAIPGGADEETRRMLAGLFTGQCEVFSEWIRSRMKADSHPFEKAAVEADLELIKEPYWQPRRRQRSLPASDGPPG